MWNNFWQAPSIDPATEQAFNNFSSCKMTADSSKNLLLFLHLTVRMSETLTEKLIPCVPQGIFTQVQLSEVWIANENRGKISANSLWTCREKTSRQPGKKERHRIGHSFPTCKTAWEKKIRPTHMRPPTVNMSEPPFTYDRDFTLSSQHCMPQWELNKGWLPPKRKELEGNVKWPNLTLIPSMNFITLISSFKLQEKML